MLIPADWMPSAKMARIICHWTAGAYKANATDRSHYHIIIEGDGKLVRGVHPITANVPPLKSGGYAAHTLNCNSSSIGVSMCCMGGEGVKESPFTPGKYPMTIAQWNTMVQVVVQLCRRYSIKVTPQTVLSHAEVQGTLGIAQRGKWDFTRLAFDPSVIGAKACGDKLRREVAAAMGVAVQPTPAPPVLLPPKPVQPLPDDPGPEIPLDTGKGSVPAVVGWAAILAALGVAAAFITKHLGIW